MVTIPDELEQRLKNWGRWARQCPTDTSSPISAIARQIAREAAEDNRKNHQRPINYQDAVYVNSMWQRMPFGAYEDRKIKLIVAAMYTSQTTIGREIARIRRIHKVRIREAEVDELFEKGIIRLARALGYAIY